MKKPFMIKIKIQKKMKKNVCFLCFYVLPFYVAGKHGKKTLKLHQRIEQFCLKCFNVMEND